MLKRNYLSRKGPQVEATGEDEQGNINGISRGRRRKEGEKVGREGQETSKETNSQQTNWPKNPSSRRLGGAGKCKNFRQGINCCLVVLFRCLVEDTQQQ